MNETPSFHKTPLGNTYTCCVPTCSPIPSTDPTERRRTYITSTHTRQHDEEIEESHRESKQSARRPLSHRFPAGLPPCRSAVAINTLDNTPDNTPTHLTYRTTSDPVIPGTHAALRIRAEKGTTHGTDKSTKYTHQQSRPSRQANNATCTANTRRNHRNPHRRRTRDAHRPK